MKKIKWSIIVPTFNSSEFITRLLDTIPKRDDLEVIIVDDHSEDFKILEKIVAGYDFVKLIQNVNNQGAGNARQAGLEQACGTWLLFADSDDRFTLHFNDTLDFYADSDAEIILFIPKAENTENSRSNRCDYYQYLFNQNINKKISDVELSYRLTNVWSKMYRRASLGGANFEDTLVADDVQFAAQAAFYTRKKIIIDKLQPVYVVTERAGSVTSTRHKDITKFLSRVKTRMKNDKWIQSKIKESKEARIRIRRYESVMRRFFLTKKYNNEKHAAWTFNPFRGVLRTMIIARKATFAVVAKPFLGRITKQDGASMGTVDVVYCVDTNVVEQSLISLVSLLENNTFDSLNAHYLYAELSGLELNTIKALEKRYDELRIIYHKIDGTRLEGMFSKKYTKITPIGYGRFLLAETLPKLNKILYLDTDVVCVGDISSLWDIDVSDNFAAAVPEYPSWSFTGVTRSQEKERLFIARKNETINSGVVMFNLEYLRKQNTTDLLFKTDKTIINRMNQDQDIYNVVFEGKMVLLPVIYNLTATTYTRNLSKIFNAVFIHYTGPNKPWNEKHGLKKITSQLDLRLPYYRKYEKIYRDET